MNLYLTITIAAALYLLGMFVGFTAGEEHATFSIAKTCVHENTFDHDGYKFYCIDEDDYYAPVSAGR